MNNRKKESFLLHLLFLGACGFLIWCFWKYALRWVLPFILAYAAAMVLDKPITWCQKRLKFQRGFSAAVFTVFSVALLGTALFFFLSTLLTEAYQLLLQLPQWLSALEVHTAPMINTFRKFCAACPKELRELLLSALDSFSQEAGALLGQLSESLLTRCAAILQKLPNFLLFFITTVLAIFYTAGRLPAIRAFLRRQLPVKWQVLAREVKPQLFSTVLKWIKAELTLIGITFTLLLGGFLLLRLRYAFLLAFVIALIDALPILGVGTVLLPWAFFSFAADNILLALALTALYLTVQLTHSLLEPRLIAAQGGLPSIAALFAMYVGFRILGIFGMILCPLLLLLLKQLHDEGYLKLWK